MKSETVAPETGWAAYWRANGAHRNHMSPVIGCQFCEADAAQRGPAALGGPRGVAAAVSMLDKMGRNGTATPGPDAHVPAHTGPCDGRECSREDYPQAGELQSDGRYLCRACRGDDDFFPGEAA